MAFDFKKLKAQAKEERVTDPIGIFQRLRVTDPSIKDLWLAQGDALRSWYENRTERDITISLNTGAGKTLVGLLIGQSLVNETRSFVVYACSSIQLVLQTEKKAEGYGLPITTYIRGSFSNDLAHKGEAVCLTTYQALFNGKSIFPRREIAAIVFDDAHAAEHLLRDHFSVRVSKERFEKTYNSIASEFTGYFHDIGLASSYQELLSGKSNRLFLIPPFEIKKSSEAILKSLRESSVPVDDSTVFSWEHLKDRIDLCAFVISTSEVTISPPFVPAGTLPYFGNTVQRVYLSATLSALDVFVRTFGRLPTLEIKPKTTAGECERMVLIPGCMPGVSDDVEVAKEIIRPHKALILVPSYARTAEWADLAQPPQKEQTTDAIEDFKSASGTEKLLLSSRYDGMDLPGDMCRVVVIDDLPSGIGPIEKFLWEYLRLSNMLRTAIACRVVQSFGRISRGMSDHGVALITGKRLTEWLQVPRNQSALPRFLQKQLHLGFQMSSEMNVNEVSATVQGCLCRQREWVDAYERFMREAPVEESTPEPVNLAELALAEARYGVAMWNRDYQGAAAHLQKTFEDAGIFSLGTVCWHKLWVGYALECSGDTETAKALYRQAHTGQRNIPPYRGGVELIVASGLHAQATGAARQFEIAADGRVKVPRSIDRDLQYLDGSGTTKQCEEALRYLGQYLGLQSSRPDNEHSTGPDVLWVLSNKTSFCFDAKTDKEATSVYRKDDLGQLADHVQWVKDHIDVSDIIAGFIGPKVLVSDSANPQKDIVVGELSEFQAVAETLKAAYRDIASVALPLTLAQVAADVFGKRGLLLPKLTQAFNFMELRHASRRLA